MTAENLLLRLDGVRRQGHGWVARCPAHDDRTPSLSVSEGDRGILVRCWAGCMVEEIAEALGLRVTDLFFDAPSSVSDRQRVMPTPRPRRDAWRGLADGLQAEAMDCWRRGTTVMEAARGLNINAWTDGDIGESLEAVACAHADLARAECLDSLAVNIRAGGLRKEADRGPQPQRSAA